MFANSISATYFFFLSPSPVPWHQPLSKIGPYPIPCHPGPVIVSKSRCPFSHCPLTGMPNTYSFGRHRLFVGERNAPMAPARCAHASHPCLFVSLVGDPMFWNPPLTRECPAGIPWVFTPYGSVRVDHRSGCLRESLLLAVPFLGSRR